MIRPSLDGGRGAGARNMQHDGGVVMLAGRGESTRMVYHALARHFAIDAVVLENSAPAGPFLMRRARKIGAKTVLGQILFQGLAEPWLKARARRRIAEIK